MKVYELRKLLDRVSQNRDVKLCNRLDNGEIEQLDLEDVSSALEGVLLLWPLPKEPNG